jgi:uncharacterized protein YlxW (UPF0749 family)
MGLKKYAGKLDEYYQRLTQGKVEKIKPSHVEKVLAKLRAKKVQLEEEIKTTAKESKKARLERKVLIAKEHIKRAELLLEEIDTPAKPAAKTETPPQDD